MTVTYHLVIVGCPLDWHLDLRLIRLLQVDALTSDMFVNGSGYERVGRFLENVVRLTC